MQVQNCPKCKSDWVNAQQYYKSNAGCDYVKKRGKNGRLYSRAYKALNGQAITCRVCGFTGPHCESFVDAKEAWNQIKFGA